jgi:hypothetical protein
VSLRAGRWDRVSRISRTRARRSHGEGPRHARSTSPRRRSRRVAWPFTTGSVATTGVAATLARVRRRWSVALALLAVACWPTATAGRAPYPAASACVRPDGVQRLVFSAARYPNIRRHFRRAVLRRGWPLRLVVNRPGADERRERLLRDLPTRDGYDRDEYPPAVGRGVGPGLERGRNPRGWKADVRYVPSSENRSHGASLGAHLEKFCDGTRFRYAFR